jgi:hypothetical protein
MTYRFASVSAVYDHRKFCFDTGWSESITSLVQYRDLMVSLIVLNSVQVTRWHFNF